MADIDGGKGSTWKIPGGQNREPWVGSFGRQFPARLLFDITVLGMGEHRACFNGPLGRRSVAACSGGHFEGPTLRGTLPIDLSNEWRVQHGGGTSAFSVEGLISLQVETGEVVLLKYIGRGGARHGQNSYRLGITFDASAGLLDHLNGVCAVGYAEQKGADLSIVVYELLGRPEAGAANLPVKELFTLQGSESVGDRLTLHGPISRRYLTLAAQGCAINGSIKGTMVKGMSWGPHRMSSSKTSFPWQIDMRVTLQTDDELSLLQHYIGTCPAEIASPDPRADRSWRTVAVYEAPIGSALSQFNELVAAGIGWQSGDEAHYIYYELE
jgi:hypothetical protein